MVVFISCLFVLAIAIFALATLFGLIQQWYIEYLNNKQRDAARHKRYRYYNINKRHDVIFASHVDTIANILKTYSAQRDSDERARAFREKFVIGVGIVAAVLAGLSALIFEGQLREMRLASEISREAFTQVQRAFVSVVGFKATLIGEISDGQYKSWYIWPTIINDGNTRALGIQYTGNLESIISDLSALPSFMQMPMIGRPQDPEIDYQTHRNARYSVVLRPDHYPETIHAIPGSWILNSIGSKEEGTLWELGNLWNFRFDHPYKESYAAIGVIHYRDVFPRTDEHITKFCLMIIRGTDLDGNVVPKDGGLCQFWNCTDEQCDDDKAKHDEWVADQRRELPLNKPR